MSEQGVEERTNKRRKTSSTSFRSSNERPCDFLDILVDDNILERWDDEEKELESVCANLMSYFNGSPPPGFDRKVALQKHVFLRKAIENKSALYNRVKLGLQRSREHITLFLKEFEDSFHNVSSDVLCESMAWKELELHCLKRLKLFLDHEDAQTKPPLAKKSTESTTKEEALIRENQEIHCYLNKMILKMGSMQRKIEELKEKQATCVVMNAERVAKCLDIRTCIQLIAGAFIQYEHKMYQQPLRFGYRLPLDDKKVGILASMPAFGRGLVPYCSTKVITVFPSNRQIGKHSHQGIIVLFEAQTGELKAIIDATEVTAKRTAAASAVATATLASDEATMLTLIGCGEQAKTHLEAITIVRPTIRQVNIWSRTSSRVDAFIKDSRLKYPMLKFVSTSSAHEACKDADIICTLTSSRVPLVTKDMVKPGAHINAVGACTPDMRELSSDLVASATIVTDDLEACMKESGDVVIPKRESIRVDVKYTIGKLFCDGVERHHITNSSDITIFESLGLAIEDLACAEYLYENFC